MESMSPIVEVTVLIPLIAGLVWLVVEIAHSNRTLRLKQNTDDFVHAPPPPPRGTDGGFGATMPEPSKPGLDLLSGYRPFI